MGRLQQLSISALLLYGSVAIAVLSTNKKDLERAAELAVERAAEKAAERAVEKALNSGNSSTITVTVKESYSNAKKTAEEAAAPGSESTRPYDPKIYDRQYAYTPPGEYKVDDSAEAEELGISKESLNSSVENLGATAAEVATPGEADRSVEAAVDAAEIGFNTAKELGDKPAGVTISVTPTIPTSPQNFDSSTSLDFGADFGGLDVSDDFKGEFGLKSTTKTFSSSYSKTKDDFPETKVDVDDEEDAEIFKMYAGDFGDAGWSSAKQEGWVRHRPLWDDSKSRVNRDFWDDFGDISAGETQATDEKVQPEKQKAQKLHKRMVGDPLLGDKGDQIAVPLATLSLDPKTPATLYQLLQREVKLPTVNGRNKKVPLPMKVYITIPVPYLPSYAAQRNNNSESKTFDLSVPPKELNDEMNVEGSLGQKDSFKRSFSFDDKDDFFSSFDDKKSELESKDDTPLERSYRSLIKVPFKMFDEKSSDPKVTEKST